MANGYGPAPNNPEYVPTVERQTQFGSITRPWVTRYPGHLERQEINVAVLPSLGPLFPDELRPLSPSPVTRNRGVGVGVRKGASPPIRPQYGLRYANLRAPRWAEGAYGTNSGGAPGSATQHGAWMSGHAPNALSAIAAVTDAGRRRNPPLPGLGG